MYFRDRKKHILFKYTWNIIQEIICFNKLKFKYQACLPTTNSMRLNINYMKSKSERNTHMVSKHATKQPMGY